MRILSVWAPPPKTVLVQVGENRIPMIAGTGGRWTPTVPAVESGSNYGFILDDEGPLPPAFPQVARRFCTHSHVSLNTTLSNRLIRSCVLLESYARFDPCPGRRELLPSSARPSLGGLAAGRPSANRLS